LVVAFTPEVQFDQDLGKFWDEGFSLYRQLYEQCAYLFPTPDGLAKIPCACQGRGTKHRFHVPSAESSEQKNAGRRLREMSGDFVSAHERNTAGLNIWRRQIQTKFCRFYRRIYSGHQHLSTDALTTEFRTELMIKHKETWTKIRSNKTCMACLQAVPDHVLSCGHAYCPRCIQEVATPSQWSECAWVVHHCILCNQEDNQAAGHSVQLRPRCAGVRILCLDGGGVRGIVELGLVQALEREIGLSNVRLAEMFDLVVGTSTGGIIALSLAMTISHVKTEHMIQFFTKVSTDTFANSRAGNRVFTRTLMIFRGYDSVYSEKPLEDALKQFFGSIPSHDAQEQRPRFTSLFAPAVTRNYSNTTRVAVTAARDDGDTEILISNYNRPSGQCEQFEREDDLARDLEIWEAALATSAAPFYLPAFRKAATDSDYIDGAVYANCPARVAMDEKSKIWPGDVASLDALVSLGTGRQGPRPDKLPTAVKFRGFTALQKMVQRQLNTEKLWEGVCDATDAPKKARLHRLNPQLDGGAKYVELYHYKEIPRLLKETQGWAAARGKGLEKIQHVARILLACLFFYEPANDSWDIGENAAPQRQPPQLKFKGSVRCRLWHQSTAVAELLKRKVAGFFHAEMSVEEANAVVATDSITLQDQQHRERQHLTASRNWKRMVDLTSGSSSPEEMVKVRDHEGCDTAKFRLDFEVKMYNAAAIQVVAVELEGAPVGAKFVISGFPATFAELRSRAQGTEWQ